MAAWSEKCVQIDTTVASGSIHCILCDDTETEIKPKPKRVFYFSSEKRSGFWVLANFKKHLEKVHSLKATRSNKVKPKSAKCKSIRKPKIEPNVNDVSIPKGLSTATKIEDTKHDSLLDTNFVGHDSSIEFISLDDQDSSMTPHEGSELWLHNQISEQITEMVAAVLINSEKQETMEFKLINQPSKFVSVVATVPDGNCLFSALAHQLWKIKINYGHHTRSEGEHEKMTKKLRSAVVEHILQPENYPLYEPTLQETVSALKIQNDVDDLTAKCKSFVRNVLSREREWGGLETINAVSMMHRVNVLVINE